MTAQQWRDLDPRYLLDWPRCAQAVVLIVLAGCLTLAAYCLLLQPVYAKKEEAKQQVSVLNHHLQALKTTNLVHERTFARDSFDEPLAYINRLAQSLHLTLQMGTRPATQDHGSWIEHSQAFTLQGHYSALAKFIAAIETAPLPMRLDDLVLNASEQTLEMQAVLKTLHQTARKPPVSP